MRAVLKATVGFAILVGLTQPAQADPVITPIVASVIGATIFGSTTVAAVATFVVTTALEFGAALAASKIAGLFEHAPERQAQIQQLSLGESAKDLIFGTPSTGGSLADAFNYGGDNGTDWEVRRIWLACHKSDLVGFWVNNFYVPYTGDGVVPDVTGRPAFNGQLAVYFRSGALDQVPPSALATAGGYTAADNAAGTAEVWVAYKADKADAKNPVWQGGRPQFKWLVKGKRCYDPRKDSTVAGGDGAHRWTDPTTWEYTRNAIVCRYNWARGIYAGDQVDKPEMLLMGRGLSAVEAPPERIIAWANLCDEQVAQRYLNAALVQDAGDGDHGIKLASADGIIHGTQIVLSRGLSNEETVTAVGVTGSAGLYTVALSGALAFDHLHNDVADWESDASAPATRPRYAIDGVLKSDETFETQEGLFAAACAGRLIQPEGGIEIEPGFAKTPVFSITDDDLVGRAPVAWSDFGSSANRVNTIIPSFTDPAQLFDNHAAPIRRSTDDIAADGGPKEVTLSLELVTVLPQAQELGEIERQSRRFERTCTITLPPLYSGVEEGDWFNYASARRAAGLNITWEVVSYTVDAKRRTTVTAKEVSATIFERDGMTDELPPTGGNLPSATPPDAVIPQSVNLDSYTASGASGRQGPAAAITFDPPGYAGVSQFLVEYRVLGTTNSLFAYTDEVSGGVLSLPGLLPDTTYEWRYRYIVTSGAPTPWSDWFTFKTDDVRVSYAELEADLQDEIDQISINEDALGVISAAKDKSDASLRRLSTNLETVSRALLQVQMVVPQLEQTYQRQLAAYVEGITGTDVTDFAARLAHVETTVVDLEEGKASSSELNALDAQINTPISGLQSIVGQLQETVAALDPSSATATLLRSAAAIRVLGQKFSSLTGSVLNIQGLINDLQKNSSLQLAWYNEEITTTVTNGLNASAQAIGEVGVRVNEVQASVTQEQKVRSDGDSANAQTSTSILAALGALTGAGAVSAAINLVDSASVDRDAALTTSIAQYASYFGTGIDGSTTVKSLIDAEATTRSSAVGGVASDVESLFTAYGDVSAGGYFSMETQSAPTGASSRLAFLQRVTSGGSTYETAMFMDAMTSGLSRIGFKAAQTVFFDEDDNVVALFDSSGAHLVAGVFADSGILGTKVQLGELAHPYRVKLTSAVDTDNTASSQAEVFRVTVRSLGGAIDVEGWFNAQRTGSGSYSNYTWQIYRTAVGTGFAFGDLVDSALFYMNDGGEVHRGFSAYITDGVFSYDSSFDVVLVAKNDSAANKPIRITNASMGVIATR